MLSANSIVSELNKSKSKSNLYYDRRSAGQFVLEQSTHLGLTTRSLLLVWHLRSCPCRAPSLTRGRVCLFYVLLALASAVFLWSESLGTWEHLLLSHIWDFPFRRLLRLAGSRWRYSIPPPHGYTIHWTELSDNSLMYSTVGSCREHLALGFVAVCTGNVSIVSLHW
jgi:hypothetical protein